LQAVSPVPLKLNGEKALEDLIRQGDWQNLMTYDTLEQAKENGFLYQYEEGTIDFPPTFKYVRVRDSEAISRVMGKQMVHPTANVTREYAKDRDPAWCDRVLVKALPECVIKPLKYSVDDSIMTSDHSPVFATFAMNCVSPPSLDEPFFECDIVVHSLEVIELKASERSTPDPVSQSQIKKKKTVQATYRFGFMDEICRYDFKVGRYKRKSTLHRQKKNVYGSKNPITLGPFITTIQNLSCEYMQVKIRDSDMKYGSAVISLHDVAFNSTPPGGTESIRKTDFSGIMIKRSFPRGRIQGEFSIRWKGILANTTQLRSHKRADKQKDLWGLS